ISDLNEQMEQAANAQSQVAETINGNVREISQSAEQTSTDAQQTARIAEQLLSMANTLQETVGQFRLG
ncbi:MAG: methyl-accepting chemotaxis protein, partial [Pseudomonadota bacterium]